MNPTKKLPLFVITGASGVGKSTISEKLFENEMKYIVLESDILWHDRFNSPETDYREYSEFKLRLCKNISQAGLPVVLCGCVVPRQFEICDDRKCFSDIHYIAITSDEETLVLRMKDGRKIQDENWINSSVDFNRWLKENADKTEPPMTILDYSNISIEEAAGIVDAWICARIQ